MSFTLPLSGLAPQDLNALHARINSWYLENRRDLPWRTGENSSWEVMVSEFMLQQTPVKRVLPVWEVWLDRWPTPADLAAEDSAEAVRAWGRLGYPRRALRLHAAAQAIVERHGGQVPSTYDELLDLPGVGSYTAAAISVFAFGNRATVIDTNIRRVHARLVSGRALPGPSLTAAETRLADELMPADTPTSCLWNVSVMELGALICTAKSPDCASCPVADACAWVAAGKPEADYQPKGQAWAGTDRQLRGAMLGVLRAALAPVPSRLLTAPGQLDFVVPTELVPAVEKLQKLSPTSEQIERCYLGLVADGLAKEHSGGLISL
ncbi:A/G-specific adenine glycosylase [Rothia sp. CCM 9416]|uniref:A/G-specific adenine glycosylase n=1 Tax=Rothia sp. CCM 9416 TaxID=3402655 RepID=UPI003AD9FDE9